LREVGGYAGAVQIWARLKDSWLPQRRHGMMIPPERSEEKQKLAKEYAYT
jgi:hypothetical protein